MQLCWEIPRLSIILEFEIAFGANLADFWEDNEFSFHYPIEELGTELFT